MLETRRDIVAVALCMPPQYRYSAAHLALSRGLHVLLEKPPGATVAEVQLLAHLASNKNLSLFATWHSRFAAAVQSAKSFLADVHIRSVKLIWKENVKKWHPGQQWVWQAGGLGVFDPGINGISILTEIIPESLFVTESELSFPQNKAAPIAARLKMSTATQVPVELDFDWRAEDGEDWSIECETERGLLRLVAGGAKLSVDGQVIPVEAIGEYDAIYARFAHLIRHAESEVDLSPMQLCADAFLVANHQQVAPFIE